MLTACAGTVHSGPFSTCKYERELPKLHSISITFGMGMMQGGHHYGQSTSQPAHFSCKCLAH